MPPESYYRARRALLNPPPYATLVVVYKDGFSETIANVRYQEMLHEPNPIKVDGNTLIIETTEREMTLLNVRRYHFA